MFHQDLPYEKWLGLWSRDLAINHARGLFSRAFMACRVALRNRPELSLALLPHMVVDALVSTGDESLTLVLAEVNAVLTEAASGPANDASADRAVQACFLLLDTLDRKSTRLNSSH